MANDGVITIQDIITEDALTWGEEYAKNVEKAIGKNNDLISAAKALKAVYEDLDNVSGLDDLAKKQTSAANASKKAQDAYAERAKALSKVDEERNKQMRALLTVTNRLQNVDSQTNKQLIEKRELLRQENREIKKSLSFMGQLEQKRYIALQQVQNLNAKKALGNKLSNEEQKELAQSTAAFDKYNAKFKEIKRGTGQFGDNVGNYPKGFEIIRGGLKKILPGLGALAALRWGAGFLQDSRQVAIEAKGVEFAFERLGKRGTDALDGIRESTRDLLSELDIQKAIVEFDNFNIDLEETDTLLEFVAVRAAQTGKSFDQLRDSLVEGLSKESKLRIDNLGISATELNAELEKTPNFVQAVANIAKREIAEAGSILDDAQNSQQRWNAALEDFQKSIGTGFIAKATDGILEFGAGVLRAITPTRELTNEVEKERKGLNDLVSSIITTNDNQEKRKELINELNSSYPIFNKFIDSENASNEDLRKTLVKVNSLYIKRLAIQRTIENLDLQKKENELADATARQAEINEKYQIALNRVNKSINRGVLDTDLATKSKEVQNETLRNQINAELERISILKANGQASAAQIKNFNIYQKKLEGLTEATSVFNSANTRFGFAESAVEDVNRQVEELERQLGIGKEELDDIFSDDPIVLTFDKSDFEKKQKELKERAKLLANDRLNLRRQELQSEVEVNDKIVGNDLEGISKRLQAARDGYLDRLDLIKLERQEAIKNAKGRRDEIQRINIEYDQKEINAVSEKESQIQSILASAFEKAKERIEKERSIEEASSRERILELENRRVAELKSSGGTQKERAKINAFYDAEILKVKRETSAKIIQVQINQVEAELSAANLSFEGRKKLEEQLASLKIALQETENANYLASLDERSKAEQAYIDFKKDQILQASNNIAAALDIDANNLNDFITGIVDGFETTLDGVLAGVRVVGDVMNTVFNDNINNIDLQIQKTEEEYQRQIDLAQGDAELQENLRIEAERERQKLEQKKRKEQEKQAKFNKALAITEIGISTAKAILGIWAQVPKFDFGVSAGILTAFVSALGAAQIAAVLARPIPKYATGTDFHEGGRALVGEERAEWIKEPGKSAYRITHPTELNLSRGAKVYPSDEAYRDEVRAKMLSGAIDFESNKIGYYEAIKVEGNRDYELALEMQRTREVLEKKKFEVKVINKGTDFDYAAFRDKQINWD